MDTTQEKLKLLVSRRHPEYSEMLPHWKFLIDCYEGGREWFVKNIFRYLKEGDQEFTDRLSRAYRFNHTREVVDLVDKYLFKMAIARNEDDAPESVQLFWKNATLNGMKITDFMKLVSKLSSIYGRVWIVVDSTKTEPVATLADEKQTGARAYAYTVTPDNVCDLSEDDNGRLNWILIHEQIRDDEDPFTSNGEIIDRFRLWTRDSWSLFTLQPKTEILTGVTPAGLPGVQVRELARRTADAIRAGKVGEIGTVNPVSTGASSSDFEIIQNGPHAHEFGMVPVFAADNVIGSEQYAPPSLIDDVAYLDRAIANYLSNLDAIIQDQTFSQLTIPAQGVAPGDSAHNQLVQMGTKRIFTYDAEGGGKPEYISPDPKQAEIILRVINKIINEIYHTVGLAGERTKEDNAMGIDNSSGVAKAYDFERVNSLLASKADSLELVENRLAEYIARWSGEAVAPDAHLISYPDNFDVRGLHDEFEIAARLAVIQAPETVRRQQIELMIDKLFPKLAKGIKTKMLAELKNWPPEPIVEEGAGADAPKLKGDKDLAKKLVKDAG